MIQPSSDSKKWLLLMVIFIYPIISRKKTGKSIALVLAPCWHFFLPKSVFVVAPVWAKKADYIEFLYTDEAEHHEEIQRLRENRRRRLGK